jgi:methylmalonyl-CoA mutase N-terminal domain/subunit
MDYLKKIDDMGGALSAIDNGYIQQEIQESAYRYQKAVEKEEHLIVGVNSYKVEEKIEMERLKVNPQIEAEQHARLASLRESRDNSKVSELRTRLEAAAKSDINLMPIFITCVESDMTLGEICGVLRSVWGEYQPPVWG